MKTSFLCPLPGPGKNSQKQKTPALPQRNSAGFFFFGTKPQTKKPAVRPARKALSEGPAVRPGKEKLSLRAQTILLRAKLSGCSPVISFGLSCMSYTRCPHYLVPAPAFSLSKHLYQGLHKNIRNIYLYMHILCCHGRF